LAKVFITLLILKKESSVRFKNKVVVVTGGTSGIGKATAKAFAKEGAIVVIAGRREEEGKVVASEIISEGGAASFIKTDISKSSDLEALIQQIINEFGRLDCAFNNAGTAEAPASITDLTEDEWDRVLNTNLKGVWLSMKYQIPALLKTGGGSIVNMSSVYGLKATSIPLPAYIASKHGVIGITKAAALQYASQNLRVNSVCPGWIPTEANDAALEEPSMKAYAESLHPMGRLGTQEEVAQAVLWLSSNAASFVTAHSFVADGGSMAQ